MPAISFTMFKEKILDGTKKQTIRAVSKRVIKKGDTLYLYWHQRQKDCELLKVVKCTSVHLIYYRDFSHSESIAKKDGFENAQEMRAWFEKVHKPLPYDCFYIIKWE